MWILLGALITLQTRRLGLPIVMPTRLPLRIIAFSAVLLAAIHVAFSVEAVVVEDAGTSSVTPTKSLGSGGSLKVSASQNAYAQFDLCGLPDGTTAEHVKKATLARVGQQCRTTRVS